jgi:hypothetical protein
MIIKKYFFFERNDKAQEPVNKIESPSRLIAAKYFACVKRLTLKQFLKIYAINK